ncbi:MAG: hypothetical protein NKF37_01240 [Tropheryma whipplei]|nr:hypothetical protein [Tropheryma whipplei]
MLRKFAFPGEFIALAVLFTLTGQVWFTVRVTDKLLFSKDFIEINGSSFFNSSILLTLLVLSLLSRLFKLFLARILLFLIAVLMPLLFVFTKHLFYAKLSESFGISGETSLENILSTASIIPQIPLLLSIVAYTAYLLCFSVAIFLKKKNRHSSNNEEKLQNKYIWDSLSRGVDPT